jgi:hypothetical protein
MALKKILNLRKINQKIVFLLGKTPPKEIPKELFDEYTLNNKIRTELWYFNEAGLPFPRPFFRFKKLFDLVESQKNNPDKDMDKWLFEAIEKYPVKDKTVVNIGGGPRYECIFLRGGAKDTTTIDYVKQIFLHPKMKNLTPKEYDKNPVQFDVGFSISSFEHDGLGRYGDPINPNADLESMKKMKNMIKKQGLLFLSVPVGKDLLVWNAHRVYGKIRLPMLLKGWRVIDSFGFEKGKINEDNRQGRYQPFFVLKNV